ncbi:MAG: DUF402 domain-containing protein [Longimicrobiales bacterium]
MNPGDDVRIVYQRPPDNVRVFEQQLVHADTDVIVTIACDIEMPAPVEVNGTVALESGSDAVWFTFPGLWHDIGRFHRADGTYTGQYANILTPVAGLTTPEWTTTDLFLDLWIPAGSPDATLLDEDEFEDAVAAGWVDARTATQAMEEARALLARRRSGIWPPPVVEAWTRERCLQRLS